MIRISVNFEQTTQDAVSIVALKGDPIIYT